MGRKTKASKRNTRIQKKIYVNVLIVGAVILLYICINGKFQIEKGVNMGHILELWNGYCNLIFYVKGNLFYQIQRKNTPPSIGSEMILRLAGSEPDSGRVLALR